MAGFGILILAGSAVSAPFEEQVSQASQALSSGALRTRQVFAASKTRRASAAQAEWQKVTAKDAVFTAEMPGAPQYGQSESQTLQGNAFTLRQYELDIDARAFLVLTALYPADMDVSDARASLQGANDNAAKGRDGGKFTSVTWTTYQGYTAVEAVGVSKGVAVRAFMTLKGHQAITLIYSGPEGTTGSQDADRFFKSLVIL